MSTQNQSALTNLDVCYQKLHTGPSFNHSAILGVNELELFSSWIVLTFKDWVNFRIALSVTVRRFTFSYSRVYLSGLESFLIDFLSYADDFAIDLTHHKQLFSWCACDADDLADDLRSDRWFSVNGCVADTVTYKCWSALNSTSTPIQHFKTRCEVWKHSLLHLIVLFQFFFKLSWYRLFDVSQLARVNQNFLTYKFRTHGTYTMVSCSRIECLSELILFC